MYFQIPRIIKPKKIKFDFECLVEVKGESWTIRYRGDTGEITRNSDENKWEVQIPPIRYPDKYPDNKSKRKRKHRFLLDYINRVILRDLNKQTLVAKKRDSGRFFGSPKKLRTN